MIIANYKVKLTAVTKMYDLITIKMQAQLKPAHIISDKKGVIASERNIMVQ